MSVKARFSTAGPIAFALVLAGCGSDAKPDERQLVSDECHQAVKKELRDPDSARFGEEEYIAEIERPPTATALGKNPDIATAFGFVGSVNSRNGFGGMGEFQSYQCDVFFDKDGNVLEDDTHIGYVDDLKFLENYVGNLREDAIEAVVTRSVKPDGSPAE